MTFSNKEVAYGATTSCKNVVETVGRKNDLSSFKSLLVTGLWYIVLTSPLPFIQSCFSKFWAWSCIASSFDKGWRGIKSARVERPFKANYGTMSQVLLQLVVTVRRGVCFFSGFNLAPKLFLPGINWYGLYYMMEIKVSENVIFFFSRFHSCSKPLLLQTELGHKYQHCLLLSWKLH